MFQWVPWALGTKPVSVSWPLLLLFLLSGKGFSRASTCANKQNNCSPLRPRPATTKKEDVHALIPGAWDYNEIYLDYLDGPKVITYTFRSRRGSQRLKVLEGFSVPLLAWRWRVPHEKHEKEMNLANISELGRGPQVLCWSRIPSWHLDFSPLRLSRACSQTSDL